MSARPVPAPRLLGRRRSAALLRYLRAGDHPGKLRLIGWLRGFVLRDRLIRTPFAGLELALDERDFLQRHIMLFGSYEAEVCAALAARARPGDVLWDVGAHVGSFTLDFLRQVRGHAVAFEPDRRQLAILGLNSRLNRLESAITPLSLALGATSGERQLFLAPDSNRGRSSLKSGWSDDGSPSITVDVERGDEVVERRGVPAPDLMKVDVEGCELDVFLGCSALLKRSPPRAIVFEGVLHPLTGRAADPRMESLLCEFGYAVQRIGTTENWLATRPG